MTRMSLIKKIALVLILFSFSLMNEILPLTQRYFHTQDMGIDYMRGTYLIVLADPSLEAILSELETPAGIETGNFILESKYVKGLPHGNHIEWYNNGKKKVVGKYKFAWPKFPA